MVSHGSYDPFVVSTKPPVDQIGDASDPIAYVPAGIVPGDIYITPYNDADTLERIFEKSASKIACFIIEPVIENLGIILPDEGYLERVRELCDEYGIVLIFDEVKTGLNCRASGCGTAFRSYSRSYYPCKINWWRTNLAAFGGKKKYMDFVTNGKMAPFGTFNGNPLAMAGVSRR